MSQVIVSLQDILVAREIRSLKISQLTERYQVSLLVAKLNIPGAEKDHPFYRKALLECRRELVNYFIFYKKKIINEELHYYRTGAELYMNLDIQSRELKIACMAIEGNHFLGRLFDIDVYSALGKAISRTEIGRHLRRKCFICEDDAYACTRARKHDVDIIVRKIKGMLAQYFAEEEGVYVKKI